MCVCVCVCVYACVCVCVCVYSAHAYVMHTAEVVQLKVGHDSHVFSDQVRVSISVARLLQEGGGGREGGGRER